MTEQQQAVAELRKLRYGWTIAAVARAAALDRKTLYNAINSGSLSQATAAAVIGVLRNGESGRY